MQILKTSLQRLKKISGAVVRYLISPLICLWVILAIWFAGLPGQAPPVLAVGALCLVLFAIFIGIRLRWQVHAGIFALFMLVFSWSLLRSPSNDRDWIPAVARLATAEFAETGNIVTVRNIRNFDYRAEDDFAVNYYDRTFALDTIRSVDLGISYWGNTSIAHTFLSFGFNNDQYVAVSIEIRPEATESYNPLAGMFDQYELFYAVGDERDIIRLRTNYRAEETYLYQSTATPEQARKLFIDILQRLNQLAVQPDFYGTFRQNCTTSLVKHVNKILENKIPFSGRLLLNGYSDEFAYTNGQIKKSLPFAELKTASYISEIAKTLDHDPAFSTQIRRQILTKIDSIREAGRQ